MRPIGSAILAAVLLTGCSEASERTGTVTPAKTAQAALSESDRTAIAALDRAYADAWKLDDPAEQKQAVLDLFTEDAIGIQDANRILEGREALSGFWFPEGAPPTRVTRFERTIHSIEGTSDLAVIIGRSQLEFSYDGSDNSQGGTYLIHATPDDADGWKISRFMWAARRTDQ